MYNDSYFAMSFSLDPLLESLLIFVVLFEGGKGLAWLMTFVNVSRNRDFHVH